MPAVCAVVLIGVLVGGGGTSYSAPTGTELPAWETEEAGSTVFLPLVTAGMATLTVDHEQVTGSQALVRFTPFEGGSAVEVPLRDVEGRGSREQFDVAGYDLRTLHAITPKGKYFGPAEMEIVVRAYNSEGGVVAEGASDKITINVPPTECEKALLALPEQSGVATLLGHIQGWKSQYNLGLPMNDYVSFDIRHTLQPTTCDIYENVVAWRVPDNTGVRIKDEVTGPVIYEGPLGASLNSEEWFYSFSGGSPLNVHPVGQVWMDDDGTLYFRLFPNHANTGQFVRKLSE
jgi:hypothetical protein